MNPSAKAAYLNQMVSTASPARLLVMLYDRLVLDCQRALERQEAGDHLAASEHLIHAQEIVLELRTSLRLDAWGGAETLSSLYAWLHGQLVQANTRRDPVITRGCLAIVEPLAGAWQQAAIASVAPIAG